MSIAAQPLTPEDPALSPRWLRTMLIVMALGFAGLITITSLAYRNAPPIPAQVLDAQGRHLFSGDDIGDGQAVFLKYADHRRDQGLCRRARSGETSLTATA